MINDAISKMQSFLQHPMQKVLLVLVDNEEQTSSHLENYLQHNIALVIHFDLLQPNLTSLLDNLPKTKPLVLLFTNFGKDGDFTNLYMRYCLGNWQAKVIIICNNSLLHPTLDPTLYFAPLKGSKLQKHLLSKLVLISATQPKSAAIKTGPAGPVLHLQTKQEQQNLTLIYFLNKQQMTNDAVMMQMLVDRILADAKFKQFLFELIFSSRNNESMHIAAANAITALNYAKIPFSGIDFSGIKIPRADLSGAILDGTNLSNANLHEAILFNCFLRNTNLKNSILAEAKFAKYPSLIGHAATITCLAFNHDNTLLATGDESGAIKLWDMKTRKERSPINGHTFP
jgi:hypothetical protein